MLRTTLLAVALVAASPVLALDMPLLTFPQMPVAPGTTTSAQNGK
jgi:hypothetical protein